MFDSAFSKDNTTKVAELFSNLSLPKLSQSVDAQYSGLLNTLPTLTQNVSTNIPDFAALSNARSDSINGNIRSKQLSGTGISNMQNVKNLTNSRSTTNNSNVTYVQNVTVSPDQAADVRKNFKVMKFLGI